MTGRIGPKISSPHQRVLAVDAREHRRRDVALIDVGLAADRHGAGAAVEQLLEAVEVRLVHDACVVRADVFGSAP